VKMLVEEMLSAELTKIIIKLFAAAPRDGLVTHSNHVVDKRQPIYVPQIPAEQTLSVLLAMTILVAIDQSVPVLLVISEML
jgi:hypothetical protein